MLRLSPAVLAGVSLALTASAFGQMTPGDAGIRTIAEGETASVALKAFSRRSEEVIHGSEAQLEIDQAFRVIGPLLGGPDAVEAKWREVRGDGVNVLQFEFRTRDASPLVPSDYMINGEEAEFIGWEIGLSNPIEFLDFTGDITVTEYEVFVSENGGIDFTVFDFTSSFLIPWDGTDDGRVIPLRTPGGPVGRAVRSAERCRVPVSEVGMDGSGTRCTLARSTRLASASSTRAPSIFASSATRWLVAAMSITKPPDTSCSICGVHPITISVPRSARMMRSMPSRRCVPGASIARTERSA